MVINRSNGTQYLDELYATIYYIHACGERCLSVISRTGGRVAPTDQGGGVILYRLLYRYRVYIEYIILLLYY